jgi:hypothetical protein
MSVLGWTGDVLKGVIQELDMDNVHIRHILLFHKEVTLSRGEEWE